MPPYPGEERVLTVFADIHYYFTAPTPRPLHHRFDKGSYLYIYYNSTRRTSRLEVANNPGTQEQDAFNGYLDRVQLRWSYKFPTLLTLVVDPVEGEHSSPGGQSPLGKDPNEWRLSSTDPRDEGKYMYRLHTLDVYFWTLEDAMLVVDTTKKVLSPNQMEYTEQTRPASHHDSMSPVVQQLENVAISDPAYRNGQTRNSQNQPSQTSVAQPPPAAPPASSPAAKVTTATQPAEAETNYTPMAYNPAAPAAPEPIAHREKTPPPVDAANGTGLAAAATADQHQSMSSPAHQAYAGIPGAPPSHQPQPWAPTQGSSISSPHAPPTYLQSQSVSSTSPQHPSVTGTPAFASPPPGNQNAHMYGMTSPPAMQSPGTEIYGSVYNQQPHPPLQHLQPQYADYLGSRPQVPTGGYSQYSYDQQQHPQQQMNEYDVHQQIYRPTEAESGSHSHVKPSSGGQRRGKLEDYGSAVEKRVNSFFKKLDKM